MNYGAASVVSEHFDDLLFKNKDIDGRFFFCQKPNTPFVTLKVGLRDLFTTNMVPIYS